MNLPAHPPKTLNPSIYPAPPVDSIQSNWSGLPVPGSAPLYTKNSSHKEKQPQDPFSVRLFGLAPQKQKGKKEEIWF